VTNPLNTAETTGVITNVVETLTKECGVGAINKTDELVLGVIDVVGNHGFLEVTRSGCRDVKISDLANCACCDVGIHIAFDNTILKYDCN